MKAIYEGDRAEQKRQASAAFRARNPEKSRQQWRSYKLRKTEEMAGRAKPECCEVCGGGGKICFDHCHVTEQFRGWLCNDCNLILGKAKDDAERLRKLADYLERRHQ